WPWMWRWWPPAATATATAALNRNRNQSTGLAGKSDFMGVSFRVGGCEGGRAAGCEGEAGCGFVGGSFRGGVGGGGRGVAWSDAGVGGGAVAPLGDQRDNGAGQRDRGGDQEGVVHPGGERGVADAGDLAGELGRGTAGHECCADRDRAFGAGQLGRA